MTWTCRTCQKTISGKRLEHCPVCHETFTGTEAGDMHRVGRHGIDRRCLAPAEMTAHGLAPDRRGYWSRARPGRKPHPASAGENSSASQPLPGAQLPPQDYEALENHPGGDTEAAA